MYASGRTTQTTMSKDVSVNKAFAKDEGETHELEEFTGKHLIETGDMGPAEEIEIPAFVTTMIRWQRNQLVGMITQLSEESYRDQATRNIMAKFDITQDQVKTAHEWVRSKRTEPVWMQDLAPTSKQTLIHEVTRALLQGGSGSNQLFGPMARFCLRGIGQNARTAKK